MVYRGKTPLCTVCALAGRVYNQVRTKLRRSAHAGDATTFPRYVRQGPFEDISPEEIEQRFQAALAAIRKRGSGLTEFE